MATHIPSHLWRLFAAVIDGTITSEEMRSLEHHLVTNPDVVRAYEDYCQLHIDLETQARGRAAWQHVRDARWFQQFTLSPATPAVVSPITPAATEHVVQRTRSRFSMSGNWWLSAVAATVFIGCLSLFQPRDAPFQPNIPIITAVVTEDDATRIEIDGIGTVVVDDRSSFQILGPLRARLNNGRMEMHSTSDAAREFVLETPYGEVTEIGHKFGMDVQKGDAGLVVFEGSVDLKLPQQHNTGTHRLSEGEGLSFDSNGKVNRIMAITTGTSPTFYRMSSLDGAHDTKSVPVIVDVRDNLRTDQTHRFYEIVPGGFRDDCLAYVDRTAHDWSGVDASGVPKFLLGADYIKTFNDDKNEQEIEISLTLSRPATLYVFLDDRVTVPEWLVRDWELTDANIGLDMATISGVSSPGSKKPQIIRSFVPGEYEERFTIWKRIVVSAGVVKLGPNGRHPPRKPTKAAMYAIAAVELPELQQGRDK